jgi:hypothetical protein
MENRKSQESSEEEVGCTTALVAVQTSLWSWGLNLLEEFLKKPSQD